jgi:hypothetical protein
LNHFFKLGFVLGFAAGSWFGIHHSRRFGLSYTIACVGLHGFRGRKWSWLAFRHGKDEYGINSAEAKELRQLPATFQVAETVSQGSGSVMEEKDFFNETTEQRTHTLTCPKCGQPGEYKVTWVVRRKRPQVPRGADERDRARFAKAQSYMVRRDDKLSCVNVRCRKPFEITQLQSLAFLSE